MNTTSQQDQSRPLLTFAQASTARVCWVTSVLIWSIAAGLPPLSRCSAQHSQDVHASFSACGEIPSRQRKTLRSPLHAPGCDILIEDIG
jgi:hypothetical protein